MVFIAWRIQVRLLLAVLHSDFGLSKEPERDGGNNMTSMLFFAWAHTCMCTLAMPLVVASKCKQIYASQFALTELGG